MPFGERPEPRSNVVGTSYDRGRPELRQLALANVVRQPVLLSGSQAVVLRAQFEETTRHRGWSLAAGAIMANHAHLLVGVRCDPDPSSLLRDFKSYGSRALNQRFARPNDGTWRTEQGSKRRVQDERHFQAAAVYVKRPAQALQVWKQAQAEP